MHALQASVDRPELDELISASERARARAASAIAWSGSLGRRCALLAEESITLRMASRTHTTFALVDGVVEGQRVTAVVRRDGSVDGDRLLIDRARVVVALGDTFDSGRLTASVGVDPLTSVLTVTRACDEARMVQMGRRPVPGALPD